jgi:alpha-N-acetylglucosaminidase
LLAKKAHIALCISICFTLTAHAQPDLRAAEALVQRILPRHASQFLIEELEGTTGDAFEVESRKGKIILRGNNGVAIASALYYYLNEYAHGQITWNGTNLDLPKTLPVVPVKVRKESPYQYRYYMNYCTFNYSMSWWDWPRWEKEIDWMALHGINMPLAITGQEYIWYEVYRKMGFSEEDLQAFFSGPAYFAWFWMGNLDGWGGPLPRRWMESHRELQQKIVKRERELGMKPVLPAFTGHVPASFKKLFPHAKLKQTNWGNGFDDTYILDAEDPLFTEIGKTFLKLQTEFYGTDHLYSADTFNENEPPSDAPAYLSQLSARVYEAMRSADPQAVWVMQGWLFYSDRKFWKAPQVQALLDAVPHDNMIILDLATEIEPVWKRTQAFYGKPWIWNMLHNFGGNISLFGRIEGVARGPAEALQDSTSGKLKGIGLTMEAIEQNPVLYELMTTHTWRDNIIALNEWLPQYIHNRYGSKNSHALKAWDVLRTTVYNGKDIRDGAESIIVARPTFESGRRWAQTKLNYSPPDLLPAWDHLILAVPSCKKSDGFRYDLVDVTRQVLANYALVLHQELANAYRDKDLTRFIHHRDQFLALIDDLDKLLATRTDFLLGRWIADARKWGTTDEERNLYERNARNLITLWGGPDNRLHEYSNRQWSGLLSEFYKPRWEKFFHQAEEALRKGTAMNANDFDATIRQWEWQWVNDRKDYPVLPTGDAINVATALYTRYRAELRNAYDNQPVQQTTK